MSGRKQTYVNVAQDELNRLRQQEARLQTVQSDLPQRLSQIQSEVRAEIAQQTTRMNERWRQFQETTTKLRTELAEAERRTQRRLEEGFQQAREEYTSLIERERRDRTEQIGQLNNRISAIENDDARLHQLAEDMLSDVKTLQLDIDRLPHRRFAAGKMERVATSIDLAGMNLTNGATQSSLTFSQQAYVSLCEIREEVMLREREFLDQYYRAMQSVRSLLEEVRANSKRAIEIKDADQIEVDIDFWSRGKLAECRAEIEKLESQLVEGKDTLTLVRIHAIDEQVNLLRQRLPEIIENARINIINSQSCYNVAEVVSSVMEEQGFYVVEGTYQGEDQRGPYAVKLRNPGGDEVVSIITPVEGRELAYTTDMNFFDRTKDEAMRAHFANAVCDGLRREGLEATPPRETLGADRQNEEARNLDQFRAQKPQLQQSPKTATR